MRLPAATVAAGCAAWLTALAAAQQPSQPTFRGGVELVQFDVTVLDRDRRPVEGLTAADFTVIDNGQRRPIVAFTPITLPDRAVTAAAGWTGAVTPDVVANAPVEGRLVVIVLDRAIPAGRPAQTARELASAIVDALGPGDLAAVVHTTRLATPQNFTTDRQRLRRAIQSPAVGTSLAAGGVRQMGDCACGICSVDTVARIARALAQAGPKQKAVFFIGAGIFIALDQNEDGTTVLPADDCLTDRVAASRQMFAAAQQANVVVHALDPTGIATPLTYAASAPSDGRGRPGGQQVLRNPDSLRELAFATGGRAVLNTNEPRERVPELFKETQSYYLLSFEAAPGPADGRMRRVEVKVNRPDVEVRARRGYYPRGAVPAPERGDRPSGLVATDIAGLLPNAALPLQMALMPFARAGTEETAVGIALHVDRGERPPVRGRIAVEAMAFDANGRSQASVRQAVDAAAGAGPYDLVARLFLRPGRYEVRAAVEEPGGGASSAGSVYGYIDVPDFRRQRLSLSGVVLASRDHVVLPADGFSDLLPVAPTAQRTFVSGDRVTGFVRVYQQPGRQAVSTTAKAVVLDTDSRVMHEHAIALDPARFDPARAADYQFDLPVARLPPGEYLLRIEAVANKETAERSVRFRVR